MSHLHSFLHSFHVNIQCIKKVPCASVVVVTVCTLACTSIAFSGETITGTNSIKMVEASNSYHSTGPMENTKITSLLLTNEKSEIPQEKNATLLNLSTVDKKQAIIK
ncbi:MAG: hypothetical protein Q4G58_17600, partial [bacterium]|nr:hypothetical protein [bacterium]